jgi:tetratricopeptide (TPR) repeat protein
MFALALLAPTRVAAQRDYSNVREMRTLPEYCRYTQDFRAKVPGGNNPDEIERWTRSMGPMFNNMHHYCWGLMDVNRAVLLSNTREERAHWLSNSINEFNYVLRGAPPDFALLPEIHTRKGESLILLDRSEEGVLEFQRAIAIQADYALAYAAMSDFYKETGALGKAREWLKKGLSAAPNAKALMRRMAALDRTQKRKPPPVER